jgi:hypothetical protein
MYLCYNKTYAQPVNARIIISEMRCKTKVDMQEKYSKMHGARK